MYYDLVKDIIKPDIISYDILCKKQRNKIRNILALRELALGGFYSPCLHPMHNLSMQKLNLKNASSSASCLRFEKQITSDAQQVVYHILFPKYTIINPNP